MLVTAPLFTALYWAFKYGRLSVRMDLVLSLLNADQGK